MESITINLIPFTEDFLPEIDGKYLVRTVSTGPLKIKRMFDARVKKVWNEKKQKEVCSIDISNQIVTHISHKPIL